MYQAMRSSINFYSPLRNIVCNRHLRDRFVCFLQQLHCRGDRLLGFLVLDRNFLMIEKNYVNSVKMSDNIRLVNALTASFNATMGQLTEMSQRKNLRLSVMPP